MLNNADDHAVLESGLRRRNVGASGNKESGSPSVADSPSKLQSGVTTPRGAGTA